MVVNKTKECVCWSTQRPSVKTEMANKNAETGKKVASAISKETIVKEEEEEERPTLATIVAEPAAPPTPKKSQVEEDAALVELTSETVEMAGQIALQSTSQGQPVMGLVRAIVNRAGGLLGVDGVLHQLLSDDDDDGEEEEEDEKDGDGKNKGTYL